MIPLDAGLFINALNNPLKLGMLLLGDFFWRKNGPNIQANKVVPKSNPIVKLIVVDGRRAIAIGIPRNDVFPIRPPSCKVWFDSLFLNIGNIFIRTIKKPIRENARNALLIRLISIPSFNKRPITLNGIPNLIRGTAIYLEIFGFFFPRKKPKIKKGIILINRE